MYVVISHKTVMIALIEISHLLTLKKEASMVWADYRKGQVAGNQRQLLASGPQETDKVLDAP